MNFYGYSVNFIGCKFIMQFLNKINYYSINNIVSGKLKKYFILIIYIKKF